MNKKLAAFLTERGMTVEGNRAYGIVNGYETNALLVSLDNVSPLKMLISCYAADEAKRRVEADLRACAFKMFRFQFTPYGLMLGMNGFTLGSLLKRLPDMLDTVYRILTESGAAGGVCPVCGKPFGEETKKTCSIDGLRITMDEECLSQINAVISAENREYEEAPNNYLFGFFGALIGGIAGGGISVLFYLVGMVASVSSIVAAVLGAFLYVKFHGKPNKMMIVIVAVTTLVCMALSVFLIYLVEAGIAAHDEGLNISAFEAFRILMESSEQVDGKTFASVFYSDLAMVLLFSALGVGLVIFFLIKQIKRPKNIQS